MFPLYLQKHTQPTFGGHTISQNAMSFKVETFCCCHSIVVCKFTLLIGTSFPFFTFVSLCLCFCCFFYFYTLFPSFFTRHTTRLLNFHIFRPIDFKAISLFNNTKNFVFLNSFHNSQNIFKYFIIINCFCFKHNSL